MSNGSDTSAPAATNPTIGVASVTSSFIAVIAFYFPLAVFLFLLFCFLRTRFEDFYYPRLQRAGHLQDGHPRRPPVMKAHLFGWVLPTMDFSDAKMYKACGVDALVYIRFLRLCIVYFAVVGVLGIGLVVPFNYTAEPPPQTANVTNYLSGFSIANIEGKSDRLYVHLTATIVFTLLLFYLMWRAYEMYFELRCAYQRKSAPFNYSVMCSDIRLLRGETLERRFDVMFPGQVLASHRTHVCEALMAAIEQKDNYTSQLARARFALPAVPICESYQTDISGTRPHHFEGSHGPLNRCFGRRVDSIEFYSERIAALTQEITLQQANDQMEKTRVGFVTFRSRFPAMVLSQSVFSPNIAKWHIQPAPQPSDVAWLNLQYGRTARMYRTALIIIVLILLILFWAVPILAVQGIANLDKLATMKIGSKIIFGSLIKWIKSYPSLYAIISGILPSLVLIAFNAFLPDIIRALQSIRRFHLHNDLDRACLIVHFAFLILNTLFVSVIGGVIYQSLLQDTDLLLTMLSLLSATLPNQATFFMTYILLQGLITHLVDLVRPKDFVFYLILRFWYCKTKEEYEKAAEMGCFPYPTRYAQEMLIFTVTLVYSVMSPPVIIVALLYFCIAYVVARYNTIFVFRQHHESGGLAFPTVINCIFVSILAFQLVMFGVFSLRRFDPGVVVAGLAVITVIFWIFLHNRFYKASRYLPLEFCLTSNEEVIPEAWSNAFCQPELKEEAARLTLDDYDFESTGTEPNSNSDLVVRDVDSASVIVPLLRR